MKVSIEKRFLSLVMAFVMVFSLLPWWTIEAHAATTNNVTGVACLTASGDHTVNNKTITLTATKGTGCGAADDTKTVTLTNDSEGTAALTFTWKATADNGNVTVNGTVIADPKIGSSNTVGPLSLQPGDGVTIEVLSQNGGESTAIEITDITLVGTVAFGTPDGPGTYTVTKADNTEITPGTSVTDNCGTTYALVAIPDNENVTFQGWFSSGTTPISTDLNYTLTNPKYNSIYPKFAMPESTITFNPAEHGTYTVNGNNVPWSDTKPTGEVEYTLTAGAADDGYMFYCWQDNHGNRNFENPYTFASSGDATYTAVFVPTNSAKFEVGGQPFYDLNDADKAARDGTSKTIIYVGNKDDATLGTLYAGNYTISAGNTLLIPYNEENDVLTTEPAVTSDSNYVAPSAYCTLIMANGANITVNGEISIGGTMYTSTPAPGAVCGAVGFIQMESNSCITVNSGAKLYAWGYIAGSGAVVIKNGGTVYENFQVADFKGGDNTSKLADNENGVFPFNHYHIQNVEVPMTLEAGAIENGHMAVSVTLVGIQHANVPFIGDSGMFNIKSGHIIKDYNEAEKRLEISVAGEVEMKGMSISMKMGLLGDTTIDTNKFVLPITSTMTVRVKNGGKAIITQNLCMIPGSKLYVEKGADLALSAGKYIIFYDEDDWGGYSYGLARHYPIKGTSAGAGPVLNGDGGFNAADKGDAFAYVEGKLDASTGYVYTTAGGAAITAAEGATIVLNPGEANSTYQVKMGGSDGKTLEYDNISITPAKLQNADGSYLETAKGGTNTYVYRDGKWVCAVGVDGCDAHHTEETVSGKDATCTETGLTEGKKCSVCGTVTVAQEEIPAKGHSYSEDCDTSCNVCGEARETSVNHTPGEAATCTTAQTCTVCGETLVAALGHKPGAEATCTTAQTCTVCGETLVAALGHKYEAVVTAPTCTAQGYTTYTCSVCGDSYVDDYVNANGHNPSDTVVENNVAPDCENAGSYDNVVYCTVCNEELSRETVTVPATGHNPGDTVVENKVAPDCENAGSYDNVIYCTVCNEELSRETVTVDANGHNPGDTVVENDVDPDCENAGSYDNVIYCTVCNEELSRETVVVDAKGHTPGAAATCTTAQTCTVCGAELVAALGHEWNVQGYEWAADNSSCTAKRTCIRNGCGAVETAQASVEADVTKAATCLNYGETTYTATFDVDWANEQTKTVADIPAIAHKKKVHHERVEATCMAEGTIEYWFCPDCGENFTNEDCTEKVTTDDLVIEKNPDNHPKSYLSNSYSYNGDGEHTYTVTCQCGVTTLTEVQNCTDSDGDEVCDACEGNLHVCGAAGTLTETAQKVADCTNAGHQAYWSCSCGKYYSNIEASVEISDLTAWLAKGGDGYIAPLGHRWVAADCNNPKTCSVCNETEGSALGHSYSAVVTAPTCTEPGYTTHTCSVCGDSYTDTPVDATGHTEEAVPGKDATCTETGLTEGKKCSSCGETLVAQEEIPAKGHSYGTTWKNNETSHWHECACGEKSEEAAHADENLKDHKCDTCERVMSNCSDGDDADHKCDYCGKEGITGHVFSEEWKNNETSHWHECACGEKSEEAAHADENLKDHKCDTCERVMSNCSDGDDADHKCDYCGKDGITGHIFSEEWKNNETSHWHECACGEKSEEAAHASDDNDHNCDACGKERVEGHTPAADDGNCTTAVLCSVCGEVVTAAKSHIDGDDADHVCDNEGCAVDNITDHEYDSVVTAPTCTEQGYTTHTCSVCGDSYTDNYVDANGHKYQAVVTAPTCTAQGYTTYTCSVCGHSYKTDYVSALNHIDENQDHYCDRCNVKLTNCVDEGRDHKCDYTGCKNTVGKHEDSSNDGDHICDYCKSDERLTDCVGKPAVEENKVAPTVATTGSYDSVVYCAECNAELNRSTITIPMLESQLVVEQVKDEDIPEAVQDTYETVEELEKAMSDAVIEQNKQVIEENPYVEVEEIVTSFVEIGIEYKDEENDSWQEAGKDQMPENGRIRVVLPVPVGTNLAQYTFFVAHMHSTNAYGKNAGDIEYPEVTEIVIDGKEYIEFYVTGLSPVIVSGAMTDPCALGHSWVNADCDTPKTCSICGTTEGDPLGHTWTEATCTVPKTCNVCSTTEGKALGHSYDDGVYTEPTFDADGYTTHTCSACDNSYVEIDEGTKLIAVAKVGQTRYESLPEAIAAAKDGDTVTLLKNATGAGAVINKSITIDFGGHTYSFTQGVGSTGTESNGFQILKGNNVTLKNGTLNVAAESADKFYILVQNYANLTVTDMTLDGTNLDKWSKTDGDSYTLSNNCGNVNIIGVTTIIANDEGDLAFAFDACNKPGYTEPVVTVAETVTVRGKVEAVAKIGNVYYATLTNAVANAKDGNTVTLVMDAAGAGVVIDNSITIDFGGFTYSFTEAVGSTGTASNGFQILQGNNVTLKNGTLNVAEESKHLFYILVQNYANLNVINMTLDGTNLDKWSMTDDDSYVLSNNSGTVNITGNTSITANDDGDLAFAFDVCKYGSYAVPVVNVNTTGKITGKIEVSAEIPTNLNISNGIYTVALAEEWCADGFVPIANSDGTYGVKQHHVFEVDGVKYASLSAAVAAANAGDTIKLLCNEIGAGAVIDKNITIDFGGYTYTFCASVGSTGTETLGMQILVGNTVTLKNGTLAANGEVNEHGKVTKVLVQNYADLTLDGMNLVGNENILYCLSVNSGDVKVINSTICAAEGKVAFDACQYSTYAVPVVTVENSNITGIVEITGGALNIVSGVYDVDFQLISGSLKIFGGSFSKNVTEHCEEGYHTILENGRYVYGAHQFNTAWTVTSTEHWHACVCGMVADKANHDYSAEVSAPTFDADGYTTFTCECGYSYVEVAVGSQLIAVAMVGETRYVSLAEAIAAAEDGAIVTLLMNASGAGVVIDKSITIDFGGFTYSFTEAVGSTGTASNGFQILQGNNVTLKNGTLNVAEESKHLFYILVQNYANLNVIDMTLDGTNLDKWSMTDGDSYVLSNNSGTVNITGNTSITANDDGDLAFAFDVCKYGSYAVPVVNVNTTGKITGKIEVSAEIPTNLNISNGIYTVALAEEWCAPGFHCISNEDGTYGVQLDPSKLLKGDLNLDGKVNSDDLTLLARHVAKIEQLVGVPLLNADVNGDGNVDSDDLTIHARYVARIISQWPEETEPEDPE